MANIMDYLDWRGDLSFEVSEFNEVDNLILSELVYVDFTDIVPPTKEGAVSLKKASKKFFERHTDEEINAHVSSTKAAPPSPGTKPSRPMSKGRGPVPGAQRLRARAL